MTLAPVPILYVHPSNELYGSDRSLLRLVLGMRHKNYEPHVFLPDDLPYEGLLAQTLADHQIPYCLLPLGVLRRQYFTPLGMLKTTRDLFVAGRGLADYCRKNNIKLIHSNSTAVFAGAIAARLAHTPHIWHVREIITQPRWFNKFIAAWLAWGADQLIAVSNPTRESLVQTWPSLAAKTIVLHNGLDPAPFLQDYTATTQALRQELGLPANGLLIGCIGRISAWKGQAFLLQAAIPLLKAMPNCHLLFVGGSVPSQEWRVAELEETITQHQLNTQVHLYPFQKEVAPLLAALDIFVSPSTLPDPFPGVIVEAMLAGKPVVATNHGGAIEQLDYGRVGLLANPNDPTTMTQALHQLLTSPSLRQQYAQASQQYALANFTVNQHLARIDQIYQQHLPRQLPLENFS